VNGVAQQLRLVPFLDLAPTTSEVRERVISMWQEVLDRTAYVGGPYVQDFEQRFAAYCGTSEAIGVGNGTDAIQLGLRALGIGAGDEVIVPANTFVATVEAIVLAGARPRFVDVDPDTLLITADAVRAAVTPATRAVIVVHLYGQLPDMDSLTETASALGLVLIEDAAQAHGASWRGRRAGSFGAVGCFSFYPGKNLGAFGDAGAVTTSHPEVAAKLRAMRDHGRAAGSHHSHEELGTNSRLDTMQAIVLDAKLDRLEAWNRSRRRLANAYRNLLTDSRAVPVAELPRSRGAHHLAVVQVDRRDEVRQRLASQGVVTGIHYPTPCHLMRPYRQYADRDFPVAERAAGRVLSLPLHPHLSMEDVAYVADRLREVTGSWG
jgi:dTDP-4-amino-4,6-dideoxygalactose transaminase